MEILDSLIEYLENTPEEKLKTVWEEVKYLNEIGPDVPVEYLENAPEEELKSTWEEVKYLYLDEIGPEDIPVEYLESSN